MPETATEPTIAKPLYGLTPVPRVRIPPSPPDSLDCREILLFFLRKCEKSPDFCDSFLQTGPEKAACQTQQQEIKGVFSGGHKPCPVLTRIMGEHKAITKDRVAKPT